MKKTTKKGFTLVELLIVIVVVGIMATVAIPQYESYALRVKISEASNDLLRIQMAIDRFESDNFRLPDNLGDIGMQDMLDPWGHAYVYEGKAQGEHEGDKVEELEGEIRISQNLNLLPVGYDLFSTGAQEINATCEYDCELQLGAAQTSNRAVAAAI